MVEGLSNVLPDIALCMAAPDADIPKLTKLQQVVLLMIHEPSKQQPPGGQPGAGPPSGAPGAPGGPPAGLQGQGLPGGPPGAGAANPAMRSQGAPQPPSQPGGVTKPMTPDPEEVRRVMSMAAGEEDQGG